MSSVVLPDYLSQEQVTGVIIAGGQGSRVGFQQKALLPYQGQAILSLILKALSAQVNEVWVNANTAHERYERYSNKLFSDDYQGYLGPLAGMHAAWQFVGADWVLFVPCDNPHFPSDLLSRCLEAYQKQPSPIVAVHDGERLQPLYLLMHRSMEPYLKQALVKRHLSVTRWVQENDYTQADFSQSAADAFSNMNTLAGFDLPLKND